MENIDIVFCIITVFWTSAMIYFLIGLLPAAQRRQHGWECKLKGSSAIIPMSRLRRVAAVLMVGTLASQSFARAFHFNLSTLTGISSSALSVITFFLLPAIVIILGIRDRKHFKS
jgi:hypothetical protein